MWRLAIVLLHLASDQQVELLVGATEFDVGAHRHRIVSLHQRIEEFVNRDRLVRPVALAEIVALEHARDGGGRRELDHAGGAERVAPLRVEANLGLLGVEDLEHLRLVRDGIGLDLRARQRRPRHVLACGIADQAGEIADEEHDVVPQFLELAHLVDEHRMAKVQVRRSRIEAGLDAQRPTAAEFPGQFIFDQQLAAAALDDAHRGFNCIALHCAPHLAHRKPAVLHLRRTKKAQLDE